jgi:hypothetical protein
MSKAIMSLVTKVATSLLLLSSATALLADPMPTECDVARDRAKSKYGAVRYFFDTFNRCVAGADDDVAQCRAELNDQQSALGDFIFAQRVAQDVCGQAGRSGDLKQ